MPSSETSAGSPRVVVGEVAWTTPGSAATLSVTSWTRAVSAGSPCGVSTTITMPAPGAWPVAASMRSTARTESASSLAKPPEASREPASGPPKNPATSTNRNTASRLRRGWELRKRDTRPDRRGALGSGSGVGVERGERVWFVMPRLSAAGAPGSSCRGRHFTSWPRAAYSRGGTPRAVRCGRGIHHPTRTPARLARHPRGDPGRGADAVRGERVRRHVGPRGRHRRRGRRGAGAPLLRDQGRPVPRSAANCPSTHARCWLPSWQEARTARRSGCSRCSSRSGTTPRSGCPCSR